jgi:hypothetical protein
MASVRSFLKRRDGGPQGQQARFLSRTGGVLAGKPGARTLGGVLAGPARHGPLRGVRSPGRTGTARGPVGRDHDVGATSPGAAGEPLGRRYPLPSWMIAIRLAICGDS